MMIDVNRQAVWAMVGAVALGLMMAACGGGGGGGSTTNGSTNGGTNGGCTGIQNPNPNLATINGKIVIDDPAETVLGGVQVNIFDSGGSLLTQTTTDACGNLAVQVPLNATTIQIPTAAINTAVFYSTYMINGESFTGSSTTCRYTLPALTAGATINVPKVFLILRTTPPPPPPSCQ